MTLGHARGAFHQADLAELALKRELVERTHGKGCEDANTLVQQAIGLAERLRDLGRRSPGFNRIGKPPMPRHRLSGPDRAWLFRRIVADREHEIEPWFFLEFQPRLRA